MPATTLKPFYEQERKPLPEIKESVLTANNLRIGAGKDIFSVGGSGFIFRSTLTTSTVTNLANGSAFTNRIRVTQTKGKNIIGIVERTIYVGSRAAANILPSGSSITESAWQIITGGFANHDYSADSAVGTDELLDTMYVRNISAGTVSLIIDVYVRYLVNQT